MPKSRAGEQCKRCTVRLSGLEFVGHFLQHLLTSGLKRIRHCGLLANLSGKQRAQAAYWASTDDTRSVGVEKIKVT
ncbi:transposase [Limnohabitans sp.]|uniref:transposase n=1 Tax=Limnohabitans sp. TaxID=1907725 RepID=UPI0037BE8EA9